MFNTVYIVKENKNSTLSLHQQLTNPQKYNAKSIYVKLYFTKDKQTDLRKHPIYAKNY
jgi:hypothetical protein